MKKNLFVSYIEGIKDTAQGQEYGAIARYFIPEFVTAVILYSVPLLIDARFVAHLKSTSSYATLGVTNTLLHFIVKIAEGLSVGAIVMTGRYNGVQDYKKAGQALGAAFWMTIFFGATIGSILYFGAAHIYIWYKVPVEMLDLGVPFLRVRAFGIFFTFVYFAFIGFLRGIKNTMIPMYTFIFGSILFVFFDYVLIFGKFGFPAMELQGSALASVIQYFVMSIAVCGYVVLSKTMKPYSINLLSWGSWENLKCLFLLSWPVMIDKGILALSYLWLTRCFSPMGTCALASFSVIKDLERFALLPAIAFAQVVTFLASNYYGKNDWDRIKVVTKKIVLLSAVMVLSILLCCSLWPTEIIRFFDFNGEFTEFASLAFPVISVLAFFDVLQLILAGSLRGSADVKTVMNTRLLVSFGFFIPTAYMLSTIGISNQIVKFVLIYSSLYIGNAFMSVIYIKRLRGEKWKSKS
jgi:putative MATE family efflux protein